MTMVPESSWGASEVRQTRAPGIRPWMLPAPGTAARPYWRLQRAAHPALQMGFWTRLLLGPWRLAPTVTDWRNRGKSGPRSFWWGVRHPQSTGVTDRLLNRRLNRRSTAADHDPSHGRSPEIAGPVSQWLIHGCGHQSRAAHPPAALHQHVPDAETHQANPRAPRRLGAT